MPGHYTQAAPEAPRLVKAYEGLLNRRRTLILVAAGILGALIGLSIFLPVIGLSLLAIAVTAGVVAYLVWLANRRDQTHWARTSHRR